MIRMSGTGESRFWAAIPIPHWTRPYLKILWYLFSLPRASSIVPSEDPLRVPTLRAALPLARSHVFRDPLDEGRRLVEHI